MNIPETQEIIISMLKKAICESVEVTVVNKGAIKITTPFIDWKGYPVFIYVTKEGKITDGGNTINQLKSLRVEADFEEWLFKEDFFDRYQIDQNRGNLEPGQPDSPESILSYLQGIAKIPGFFEPKPIYSTADNFPSIARKFAMEALIEVNKRPDSVENRQWATAYIRPRSISLESGIEVHSDMSPQNENIMIKIISHSSSSSSDKRQHVAYNVLDPLLWKKENKKVQFYALLQDKEDYPRESRELLESESKDIIEIKDSESKFEIAKILVEV
jgi:hypothetical protein